MSKAKDEEIADLEFKCRRRAERLKEQERTIVSLRGEVAILKSIDGDVRLFRLMTALAGNSAVPRHDIVGYAKLVLKDYTEETNKNA